MQDKSQGQGRISGEYSENLDPVPDPRSPVRLVSSPEVPCPICGAMPKAPEVDFSVIRDSDFKSILVQASLTIRIYPCQCREIAEAAAKEQEAWNRRLLMAQIPPRYQAASLAQTGRSPYEGQFLPICQEYLRGRMSGTGEKMGLGFIGSIGTGKTYYLCAVLLELMRGGMRCRFINLPEFYNRLKQNFGDEGTAEYGRMIQEAKEVEVVTLDEVGQRKLSPWASEELYGIINYRYNHDLSTLFSTSKTVDEMSDAISKDTVDRIYEMCSCYQITGASLRRM